MSFGFVFLSMSSFVISCIVIVYGHLICCAGHGVYSGLGCITMGGAGAAVNVMFISPFPVCRRV